MQSCAGSPLDNLYWPYEGGAKPAGLKRIAWHLIDMWNLKAAGRFAPLLDEFKPDVVHTNNLTGTADPASRATVLGTCTGSV